MDLETFHHHHTSKSLKSQSCFLDTRKVINSLQLLAFSATALASAICLSQSYAVVSVAHVQWHLWPAISASIPFPPPHSFLVYWDCLDYITDEFLPLTTPTSSFSFLKVLIPLRSLINTLNTTLFQSQLLRESYLHYSDTLPFKYFQLYL